MLPDVTVQAIETVYNGCRFRSRLEARWAAFFDGIGWRWEYEPFDASGYIPDFLVYGQEPIIVEIKPYGEDPCQYQEEATRIVPKLADHWSGHVTVFGLSPLLHVSQTFNEVGPGIYAAGPRSWGSEGEQAALAWSECGNRYDRRGVLPICRRISLQHTYDNYTTIPCKHYYGGHLIGAEYSHLKQVWDHARDVTRWTR